MVGIGTHNRGLCGLLSVLPFLRTYTAVCVCVWGEQLFTRISLSLRNAVLFVLKTKYCRDGHSTASSSKRLVEIESMELCEAAFCEIVLPAVRHFIFGWGSGASTRLGMRDDIISG